MQENKANEGQESVADFLSTFPPMIGAGLTGNEEAEASESGVDSDKSSINGDNDDDNWINNDIKNMKIFGFNSIDETPLLNALIEEHQQETSSINDTSTIRKHDFRSPNRSICESISKMQFTRRFKPPWLVSVKFLEPVELPGSKIVLRPQQAMPDEGKQMAPLALAELDSNSSQGENSLNYDTWSRYAESENPERRESAANALSTITPIMVEEEFSHGPPKCRLSGHLGPCWHAFFDNLEALAWDLKKHEIITCVYKEIPLVSDYLRNIAPCLDLEWDQFNMRIPSHLIRMILGNSEQIDCKRDALRTIEHLIEERLLKSDVIQNTIVPGLFLYLDQSRQQIESGGTDELSEDKICGLIFSVFAKILMVAASNGSSTIGASAKTDVEANDSSNSSLSAINSTATSTTSSIKPMEFDLAWIREQFLPPLMEYFIDPQLIPVPITQDLTSIREIFAQSLAPLAKLLGGLGADGNAGAADIQLLPIFQRFMRDSTEVQSAALKQLADFCMILSPESREQLLRELSQLVVVNGETRSWRQRAEFAEQLTKMIILFPTSLVNLYLCPFALTFSADRIATVRTNGVTMLATVLGSFISAEWSTPAPGSAMPLTSQLIGEIRVGFWQTRDWKRRQSFGRLLYQLLAFDHIDVNQFSRLFHADLIALSHDPIANVRQYFCMLAQLNKFSEKIWIGPAVHNRLEQMGNANAANSDETETGGDFDLEIRNMAKIALGLLNPEKMGLDLSGRAERLAAS